MPSLEVGHRRIEYSVLKGASRRYTYFRFRPDLTLEVILPKGRKVDPEAEIRARLNWVIRESERMRNSRVVLGPGQIMYGGKNLKVYFAPGAETDLVVDESAGSVTVKADDPRSLREQVRRWFLRESSAFAVRKVAELSKVVGARPSRVDVREISKWGYCTRGGRLSFSWQLIALPERLREYIVLHELTHLVVFNHSAAFRRKLKGVCPDFRERERELDLVVPYDRLAPPA
ncbi:MAG TPA: YgjP-like metallopeptidase domain-containing protein [Nitrososphaerales archaeon]|nr:YgjP-like metallopeptidase domain-containing protein [Nitrososphaerales archaeon]